MITNGKELFAHAKKEGWAIGAFNVSDYDVVEMVMQAGEALKTPVMLAISDYTDPNAPEGRRMSDFDTQNLMRFMRERAAASPIPVIIHLDHCQTFDGCMRGIQWGATSVMMDASQESFDDNVAATKKVAEVCHACNVNLEAEIGHVSGHPNSKGVQYTSAAGAKAFYEATGVDLLAVSIGTCHGVYKEAPVLQYDLISEINKEIPAALVMHGSSGLGPDQFRNAVKAGIAKINFATYLYLVSGDAMRDAVKAAGDGRVMFQGIKGAGMARGIEYLKEHIGYFGTKPIA